MPSVMLDARHLGSRQSGIGRYTSDLFRALALLRPDLALRLLVRKPGDEGALAADRVARFDAWPYGLRSTLLLPRCLGPEPADLFHSTYHVLPRGLGCATVMTLHDLIAFEGAQGSLRPFPVWCAEYAFFRVAIPESLRRAHRIVAVSRATADEVAARFPFCRDKLRIVHHGVRPEFRPCDDRPAAERRAAVLAGPAPFVLALGGLSPNKNQAGMLRAFAAARAASPTTRMVIVARYGERRRIVELARRLGVGAHLVVLPHLCDPDLRALLHTATCLAFCSRVEGFGLPLLEAMACGCPVLTSNRSAMAEVAGDAALLADPDDVADMARQMRRMLCLPDLRRELALRGLERARGFTWQRCAALTAAVYDEALGL
ncbi:MAG: glycosyltransferase family 4 protein [Polyangiaceae bacterium]|nr:glycosyltransferase family 4 protein [Polyangiaceae bacterium]